MRAARLLTAAAGSCNVWLNGERESESRAQGLRWIGARAGQDVAVSTLQSEPQSAWCRGWRRKKFNQGEGRQMGSAGNSPGCWRPDPPAGDGIAPAPTQNGLLHVNPPTAPGIPSRDQI